MTKITRLALYILIISLAGLLSSCGGDPITGSLDGDPPPIIGLNTDGVSFDGVSPGSGGGDISISPGSTHLVTFDPPSEYDDRNFEAQCSAGTWRVDGMNAGNYLITSERSLEWVAPVENGDVQLLFVPQDVEGDLKLGMMVVVSDNWFRYPHPPSDYEREATISHPITGEPVTAAAGELLIKLNSDQPITEILVLRTAQDYRIIERISENEPVFRVKFDASVDLASAWMDLSLDPRIAVVEPNYLVYPTVVPDDPDYGNKHEFPKLDAPLAWDIATGSEDVWVAVVDTGVDRDHPDLAGNVVPGQDFILGGDGLGGETPGDGQDNNQDGIIDQNVGHGTHVAGIIAAQAFNGVGACGIAYNTKICPLRIFPTNGDTGATFSSIIQAVEYATAEDNVRVISMSIGTTYESDLLQSAINQAWYAGKLLVAAAANSNTDNKYYPAAHDNVVSVAAINKSNTKASFSNYGSWVDISAYGTGIYSTYFDDTYAYMSGTSMACPLVSGCAALLFSFDTNISNEQCVDFLTAFVDDVYEDNPEYLGQLGSGIVNPYLALNGMSHSQPGDIDDADSDGNFSDHDLELGPDPQE